MRLSVEKDDPGFPKYLELKGRNCIRVFLDGELQPHVLTADEELGEIKRLIQDASGRFQLDKSRNEIMKETVRGVVVVDLIPFARKSL